MSEQTVTFGDPQLDGAWACPDDAKGVIVFSHPHPAMGGTKDNNVVRLGCHYFNQNGFATLRYDFRGAGFSYGSHDHGIGEQDDALAAVAEARKLGAGISGPFILIGYSYGAWVNWRMLPRLDVMPDAFVMISPPFGYAETQFEALDCDIPPTVACVGNRDGFCPVTEFKLGLKKLVPDARTDVLKDIDHFWVGNEMVVAEQIAKHLEVLLG